MICIPQPTLPYHTPPHSITPLWIPVARRCLRKKPSNTPWLTLHAKVQRQYTLSKRDADLLDVSAQRELISSEVRVVGSPECLFVVARDICLLLKIRPANVGKIVAGFSPSERQRRRVSGTIKQRRGTCSTTHLVVVLSEAGLERLFRESSCPFKEQVKSWLYRNIKIQLDKVRIV